MAHHHAFDASLPRHRLSARCLASFSHHSTSGLLLFEISVGGFLFSGLLSSFRAISKSSPSCLLRRLCSSFKFSVCSKAVGFLVYALRKVDIAFFYAFLIGLRAEPNLIPVSLVFNRIKQKLVSPVSQSPNDTSARTHRHIDSSQIDRSRIQISNSRNHDFWSEITCCKCLSVGHIARFCSNEYHCRLCSSYGHIQRFYLAHNHRRKIYRPISKFE